MSFRIPLYVRFVSPVYVLILSFVCISMDSRTFIIHFELLSILQYLFCCSNCSSVSHQGLSGGTCPFDTAPLFCFWRVFPDSLGRQDASGVCSYLFPPPSRHQPFRQGALVPAVENGIGDPDLGRVRPVPLGAMLLALSGDKTGNAHTNTVSCASLHVDGFCVHRLYLH